jgi:hypothetical protein
VHTPKSAATRGGVRFQQFRGGPKKAVLSPQENKIKINYKNKKIKIKKIKIKNNL